MTVSLRTLSIQSSESRTRYRSDIVTGMKIGGLVARNAHRSKQGLPLLALTIELKSVVPFDATERRLIRCPWCNRMHAHYGLSAGTIIPAPCLSNREPKALYQIIGA